MQGRAVEFAIVGGGAAGLGIAWQLSLRGRRVTIFEARQIGSGAMTASAGMLSPAYEIEFESPSLLQAMIESRKRYTDWIAQLGDIEYQASGTYELALTPEDVPYIQRRVAFERSQGIQVEWLEGKDLRKHLPMLSPQIPAGSYAPEEAHVSPELLRDRLVEACQKRGTTLLEDTPVNRIEERGEIFELLTPHGNYHAERVIVCPGVPLEGLALPFRVYPVRGQMVAVEMPRKDWLTVPVRYFNRTYGYGYTVPKKEYLILGGTAEEKGYDLSLTVGGVMDILRRAYHVFPELYECRILRMWAGLRPATDTRHPLFYKVPHKELYYVNGLYRNGILLLPLVSEGVVQWILEGTLPPLLQPFHVESQDQLRAKAMHR
ncbi:MAG: glycine oxidase ThiO [Bacteroidia bacterium]|nr:glycine oxidase ThiO [Bacteroidia bacterium]MDW8134210.1 glycine oxidase ThiO [Bacteroidia bacterium]